MTLAGLKKCVPMTDAGREVAEAISSISRVEVLLARIAPGLHDAIQFGEDLLLQRHAFEDGLDDDVGLVEIGVIQGGLDQLQALVHHCLGEASALHRHGIILANGGQAAVERGLVGFLEYDRNSGVGEYHGDAAAHGAGADDRGRIDRNDRRFFRNIGDLGHFAFAEEDVDERLRLVGVEAVDEQPGLDLASLLERQSGGGFDGVDGGQRSDQVALLLARGVAGRGEDRRVLFGSTQFLVALARFGSWLCGDLAGESHGAVQQVAVDQLIHDAGLQRVGCLDWIAVGAHLNCLGDAGEAGQALRASGSGDEAEFHFRLSDLRAGRGHAVVAGHGHFQSAAERRAVNGHDDGLGAVFYF